METGQIRPYKPEDAERIVEVWENASRVGHPFLDESFVSAERDQLRYLYLPAADTWVLEERGDIVGFISLVGNEIGGLFVDAGRHRRGFGSALMRLAKTRHRTLEVEVFTKNTGARAFYRDCGFVLVSRASHAETGNEVLRMRYRFSGSG